MDSTRALLDELMGKDRDLLPNEKPKRNLHFTDPEVCKYFLCGFCPNELFTNTKSDLGSCVKIHDPTVREEFKRYPDKKRYPYEDEFVEYLERLVSDLDKRIKRGHERLDSQNDLVIPQVPLSDENREKVDSLTEKISSLVKQMEDLGEEGKVDESQALMQQVDQLKYERELLLRSGEVRSITQQEKRMKVCDICGAFLVIGDTDKRTASHLEGKQHQGYLKIRSALDEYQNKMEERHREKDITIKDHSRERDRDRDRGRGWEKERDRERSKERSKERSRRSSRERDRDKSRDRDRDRDRDHRSSRDKDRSRSKRSRSRSRSKERRSSRTSERERERDRDRERDSSSSSRKKKDREEDEVLEVDYDKVPPRR